eukprot:TRINITY_DN7509_c0_g1_i2.p1 TRINITY_DN7509_c0_g1~~TRINITY_DN7509_c0_g1_i2.p1  ORF type:complete len:601 (+),score=91.24 TRINITY_DN7509_c0_g1_i2:1531-3333(+)
MESYILSRTAGKEVVEMSTTKHVSIDQVVSRKAVYEEKLVSLIQKDLEGSPKDDENESGSLLLTDGIKASDHSKTRLVAWDERKGPLPDNPEEEYAEPEFEGLWESNQKTYDGENTKLLRDLSTFEKKVLAQRMKQHKESIGNKKQVVLGKEFKGHAFIPKPEKIIFKDFDVGQIYKQKIVLTNVSFTFNTFKLLDIQPQYKDFFEVHYTPPGYMSAGLTCDIQVTFTPKINEDIITFLPLLSETGPIDIPLECTTKKTQISVFPRTLDFDSVVLGESRKKVIRIVNKGALPTEARISHMKTVEEIESGAYQFPETATIQPYSTTSIDVTFSPPSVGPCCTKLILNFSDPSTPDHVVSLSASGSDVPIYVEREILDFRVCYYGTLYREVLVLRNRGSTALKFQVEPPKELKGFLEFTPTYGFVQSQSSFQVQLKFRPDIPIMKQCGKYADVANGTISVPIRVQVPDQTLPVYFQLNAQLTYADLIIEPSSIDFGDCSVNESVSVPIKITSKSILAQQYGFVNLPKEIDVQPGDGFGTILPLESITRNVIFSPRSATIHGFSLSLKTLSMREYKIPCKGVGVVLPMKLSASCVFFCSNCLR